ncbi:MAG: DUF1778 domain-containing protein [Allorhizobium sp.]
MSTVKNTSRIEEDRATERMHFRTKPHVKQAIQRAAAISGVDETAFAINAAYASALATIEAHERTFLQPVDHEAFFDALDNLRSPTDALQKAFASHKTRVISR